MNCPEAEPLIEGYSDEELDLVRNLEMEKHLEGCADCAGRLKGLQALRTSLNSAALYYRAPENLRQWARAQVPRAKASRWSFPVWNLSGWVPAAAFAALFAVLYVGSPVVSRMSAEHRLAQEVVSAHVRSLMAGHLTDVGSTDQHRVKPWFSGKLDFAPGVRDLSEFGFPLKGGRLEYVAQRPAAALVYQRRQHFINLMLWPSVEERDRAPSTLTRRGYNLIHWTKAGMTYWAVSDLNSSELEQFAQLVQNQTLFP